MNENQTNVTEVVNNNKVDLGTKTVMAGFIIGAVAVVGGASYGIYKLCCKRSKKDIIDVEAAEVNETETEG